MGTRLTRQKKMDIIIFSIFNDFSDCVDTAIKKSRSHRWRRNLESATVVFILRGNR